MSSRKRKRGKVQSLDLEDVLGSADDSTGGLNVIGKLQATLASTNIRDLTCCDGITEDLVLLLTVSKIGFSNSVLLMNCIGQVPKAMLIHRRKYIVEMFNSLTNNSVNDAEVYVDLILSTCRTEICQNSALDPPVQRYRIIF